MLSLSPPITETELEQRWHHVNLRIVPNYYHCNAQIKAFATRIQHQKNAEFKKKFLLFSLREADAAYVNYVGAVPMTMNTIELL